MRKGLALILSILIMFFLAALLGIAFLRSNIQLREIEIRRASLYAFYAAESALERAVFELRKNRNWQAGFGDENNPVSLTLADGTVIRRKVSECHISLPQGEGHTPVVLGEADDHALLGVVTLEILGPFKRTLQPMRMLLI